MQEPEEKSSVSFVLEDSLLGIYYF